jgi:acyl-CoA reductase-like NAD-dependent aldehyde dehydrogenase
MATQTKKKPAAVKVDTKVNGNEVAKASSNRIEVLKTYKLYIGGAFPRTESGRYYTPFNKDGNRLANICQSSRKDFKNAVQVARKAMKWSARAAFNRSQILYRIGEMLEARKSQFVEELMLMDFTKNEAIKEVELSVDRLIYYAGWCDKYQQVFSSVNPVASSHFNFSVQEPMGVVAVIAPNSHPLLGLVSTIAPVIAGGNTCIALASEDKPLCAITFAEVLNSSDLPGGVVNILTGKADELYSHMASHMDVNAFVYSRDNKEALTDIQRTATGNFKRVFDWNYDWSTDESQSPYMIVDCQETKTTWHPIENIAGAGSGY